MLNQHTSVGILVLQMDNENGSEKKRPKLDPDAVDHKLSDFELSIRPGKPHSTINPVTGDLEKLVALAAGTHYEIRVTNRTSKRANARVHVDGKEVLYMRLEPESGYYYERPQHIAKKFTFYPLKLAKVGFSDSMCCLMTRTCVLTFFDNFKKDTSIIY